MLKREKLEKLTVQMDAKNLYFWQPAAWTYPKSNYYLASKIVAVREIFENYLRI